MGVTVTRTGGIPTSVMDAESMRRIAEAARAVIDRRTFERHHGLDDRQLRNAEGEPVDLVESGRMRASLAATVAGRTATVGLTGRARIYGPFVNQRTPWLGLSRADVRDLGPVVRAAVAAAMARSER